ncbi:hypothetical protein ACIGC1_23895 [Peribacillus butanolivorans]|uniref:hypothetical protein n=1 Tax=Peribacillus butanolivorans TaxID=421767 RepID=UPI0037C585E4
MKFADHHLSKLDIQKFNQLRRGSHQSKPESKPKRKEELSYKDVEDTYKRVGGSVRRN